MTHFLTTSQVIEEQERQLSCYGLGDPGILDRNRLDSAVNAAQASFGGEYLLESVYEMAGAYLVRLVKAHAFGNANKRTGLASSLIFLGLNGFQVDASGDQLIELVLESATGNGDIEPAAAFFERHCRSSGSTGQFQTISLAVHKQFGSVFAALADM